MRPGSRSSAFCFAAARAASGQPAAAPPSSVDEVAPFPLMEMHPPHQPGTHDRISNSEGSVIAEPVAMASGECDLTSFRRLNKLNNRRNVPTGDPHHTASVMDERIIVSMDGDSLSRSSGGAS